jgi:putative membrane protein
MIPKRSVMLAVASLALIHPWLAFAQQSQQPTDARQPQWAWPGPWHMWSSGWEFWWIFPLCMFLMIFFCGAMFLLFHRSGWGWPHHWGPWQMMDRSSGPGRSWGDPTYSALQILNERFAKGEIEKQEYEERKEAILASGRN